VVYNPSQLNIKPKCYYCRQQSELDAPTLECTNCLNRIIWPTALRPDGIETSFNCYACNSGRSTIIKEGITANTLRTENGIAWLLRNNNQAIKEPFSGRSLYHTISTTGTEDFLANGSLFPNAEEVSFHFNGKLIRNTPALIASLQSWISRRRTETATCSLCFSSFRKADVRPACGRSGCVERICADCLRSWYGLNGPGRIVNTAALSCPFCRRAQTAKTLARYRMGIHTVGGLRCALLARRRN